MSLARTAINPEEIRNLEDGDGYATLLVSDPFLLTGWPWMLNVVNDNRQCYIAHIFSGTRTSLAAHHIFDSVFHDYVNGCCYNLGCDATVEYVVDDEVVMTKEYGWDDGSYSMTFRVYCRPDVDDLLTTLLAHATEDVPLVVITPDPKAEWGFAAHRSDGSHDFMEDAHDFLHGDE